MRKAYRLKHVPTGLYWAKKSYGHLSETGSVYTSNNHAFSGLSSDVTVNVYVDDRVARKHLDVLTTVGTLRVRPVEKWDGLTRKFIPTGKTNMTWVMESKVSDFEKEYISMEPMNQKSESSVDDKQELIEQVTRICWDQMFSIQKNMMSYEDLLERVKNQLNNK